MTDIRIALIGCGRHGRYLATCLREVPGVARIACADIDAAAAQQTALDFGFGSAHTDAATMLREAQPDAVIVATTHSQLEPATLAAIEAGCHAFVEKPLGLNARQGRQIVDAARRANVQVMVGYCLRYTPVRLAMRDLLRAGAVGEVAYVTAGKGSVPHTGWLADPHQGGGQLMFLGSHVTDQILWLLGSTAERVYAEVEWRRDNGTDATSMYTIRFANGVSAHVACSQAAHFSFDYVEFVGAAGRVRADWPTNILTVHSDVLAAYASPTTIRVTGDPLDRMYIDELSEFVSALRDGRTPAITGADGVRVLEILDGVVESGRTGQPVAIGEAVSAVTR
jgi:predicted dehydrogenase